MTINHLNILYNIRAFFIGVLKVGLNIILIIILLIKPLLVAGFIVLY